jgi:hypothetical protein
VIRLIKNWPATIGLCVLLTALGCSRPPQVAPANQKLVQSLKTAVAAGKPEWLESNAKLIEERRTAGQMSDEEYATFQSIITSARAGEWAKALKEVTALAKAQQRPNEEPAKAAAKS